MSVLWHKLGEFVERVERTNAEGKYGVEDVRGVSNTKLIQKTKASMEGRDFTPFTVLNPQEFVFNRRTTRNGDRLGLGFNQDDRPYIFTEDYVAFRVKDESVLLPGFLYVLFLRDEFDRYVRWDSWGSATEFFNWENMQQVEIPIPPIAEQRKVVEAWHGLRKMKEENEQLAEPLLALCRSYLQEIKKKYPMKEIGPMIEERNERNDSFVYGACDCLGVASTGTFEESRANLDGIDFSKYKIVEKGCFAYNPSRINLGSIALCGEKTCIVSPMYVAFKVLSNELLDEFLELWFRRSEFQRSTLFFASGSVRDTFSYDLMEKVKIPLPPIEVQQAVVDLYRCANEAKKIAAEADKLSREICPALIQRVVKEVA